MTKENPVSDDKAVAWGLWDKWCLTDFYGTEELARDAERRCADERPRYGPYRVAPLYEGTPPAAPREATTGGGDGARDLRNAAWAVVGECGLAGTVDRLEDAVRAYDAATPPPREAGTGANAPGEV